MRPFNVLFEENCSDQIEYKGKTVYKYYKIDKPGIYNIQFTFLKSNSVYKQAIVLLFSDFVGKCYLFNDEIDISKTRFPRLTFWEDTSPKEVNVKIKLNQGCILICNGSDLLGNKQICRTLYEGTAICIEKTDDNKYRFHCNDHENDDDFDDLIFDMLIKEEHR